MHGNGFKAGDRFCMQELGDGESLRAGGHVKASNGVARSIVCFRRDGIAMMESRNCMISIISGSFNLQRVG